jgi:hypothetical protein
MIKKITLTLFAFIICLISNAQLIDNYGIKIGAGLSNQYWKYESTFSDLSGLKKSKTGFIGQVYAEKKLGKYISLKPAIGYIQKGYADDIKFLTESGEELATLKNKVVLHDLSLDLLFTISPIQKSLKPYIILGVRTDYFIDYRSVFVSLAGENQVVINPLFDDFNKITYGGLIGIGLSNNDLSSIEFEYNPSFSKNFKSDIFTIRDSFFSLTFSLNINKLIKNKK